MYLVTRAFQDNGIQRISGELVTGDGYRTLSKLIELRYLKDVGVSQPPFRCQLCDRVFDAENTLEEHYMSSHPNDIEIEVDEDTKKGVEIDEPSNKRKSTSRKTNSK